MQEKTRKMQTGVVVSNKMQKTVVVAVEHRFLHKKFAKYLRKSRKFMVHDEKNESRVGDVVEIAETRPLSRKKCWCLQKILSKGEALEAV